MSGAFVIGGVAIVVLVAGTVAVSAAMRIGGWAAARAGLRRWEVLAPYVIVAGEPLRLGSRVTFGAARRLARAQQGARIYDLKRGRWVIQGRRWSERANGYLGEVVDASLAGRLLGIDEDAVEDVLAGCGLRPQEHAGRDGWRVVDVLDVALQARLRFDRTSEPAL